MKYKLEFICIETCNNNNISQKGIQSNLKPIFSDGTGGHEVNIYSTLRN